MKVYLRDGVSVCGHERMYIYMNVPGNASMLICEHEAVHVYMCVHM